jgi:CHAD domain-containing protein
MAAEDYIADLTPEMAFSDAGRVIIYSRYLAMWRHRDGTLKGDEEALHDMRVGSRRLRAALDVFASAFHGARYRQVHQTTAQLTDELGRVRDHDVMLLGLARYRKGVPKEERAGVDALSASLESERDIARRQLTRFFDELEARGYDQQMRHFFGQGVEELANG